MNYSLLADVAEQRGSRAWKVFSSTDAPIYAKIAPTARIREDTAALSPPKDVITHLRHSPTYSVFPTNLESTPILLAFPVIPPET